jgi:hypothetical protein
MKRIKAIAIFNAVSFILQLAFSYLAQSRNLSAETISTISAKYDNLITPAGMTFGIWGIIYTALAVMCLFHIIMAYKHDLTNYANHEAGKMGILFIIVNLAAAAWVYAWVTDRMLVSVILMLVQLAGLILLHIRLNIYSLDKTASVKVATEFPLAIYLGWISMATVANISSWLTSIGWKGFGLDATQWAIIIIIIAVILACWITLFRKNFYFGLVTSWFLYGLIMKRQQVSNDANNNLIIAAWIGLALTLVLSIFQLIRNLTYKKPPKIFPSANLPLK